MSDIEKRRAQQRVYNEKRASQPTFPKTRLDADVASKLDELITFYGSKKAVLTAGINLLYKELGKKVNNHFI